MSKKNVRVRSLEITTRLKEVQDLIIAEKRAMTDAEKSEVAELNSELDEMRIRSLVNKSQATPAMVVEQKRESNERNFASLVGAICNRNAMPEGFEVFLDKGDILIPRQRSTEGGEVTPSAPGVIQNTDSITPLIPVTIGEVIEPLEKGLIFDKVGMKMQYGVIGDWVLPVVGSVEANIEGENTEVEDKTIDITKLGAKPKRVAISIPVSYRAIDQSNDALLSIVNTQIGMAVRRLLNRWMFSPTRIAESASDGCFVQAIKTPAVSAKAEFTYKDAIDLQGAVLEKGIEFDNTAAYVCSARTYAQLKSQPKDAGSGRFVIEDGKIDGFYVFITEHITADYLGFGVFNYQMAAQFGKMRLTVQPEPKENKVYFVLNTDWDMLTIRPEAFAVAKRGQ